MIILQIYGRISFNGMDFSECIITVMFCGDQDLLSLVVLVFGVQAGTGIIMPICVNQHGACQTISIGELFDRAVEISDQIHTLSTDVLNEFNQRLIQGKHFNVSVVNSCHTSSIMTPQNKEDALNTSPEHLLNLVVVMLRSWRDPLQYAISRLSDHPITSSTLIKSMKIAKQMKQLAKGLSKISEQVTQQSGAVQQTLQWVQPLSDGGSIMLHLSNLLHCFRRDTNKIDSYLKLLKCRFSQQSNC